MSLLLLVFLNSGLLKPTRRNAGRRYNHWESRIILPESLRNAHIWAESTYPKQRHFGGPEKHLEFCGSSEMGFIAPCAHKPEVMHYHYILDANLAAEFREPQKVKHSAGRLVTYMYPKKVKHVFGRLLSPKKVKRDLVLQATPQRNGVRAAIARISN